MQNLDKNIIKFLNSHHLLSLSVLLDNTPYPSSAFYVFCEQNISLIIASNDQSAHIKAIKQNPQVGVCIALDTKNISLIRGVQIMGEIKKASSECQNLYYSRYPCAMVMRGDIFEIGINFIKFTDNRLGFGTKKIWRKDS